ncbi:MAG: hypothetical protein ACOY0T_18030 [Myxococcota bacterium]
MRSIALALPLLTLLACGEGYPDATQVEDSGGTPSNGGVSSGGVTSGNGGTMTGTGGAPSASGGTKSGSGGTQAMLPGTLDAPSSPEALRAFLESGAYKSWPAESAAHPSAGPHAGPIRVFYSPKAALALNAGASSFPAGAATVKEQGSPPSLTWSVWVKLNDESNGGKAFYWYELLGSGTSERQIQGLGIAGCVACHSAGHDFLLSDLPFE